RPNRRVIIDFFIPYHEDVEKAKEVVGTILKEDERILEKPAPRVVIAKFTPDYMEMQARFWVVRKHALVSRWDLNAKIKSRFDEEGIAMAAPRLEITSHPDP
ncbi:MAG: mechanosensitive ion channel, partial [Deltaproteobacteria bacterium]|nr:mechanosensitive ion channel [Deltaproteobacteria bacterium]